MFAMDDRINFFNELMKILDEAEGTRDTTFGPFSFLWEDSYVRKAVVSSFDTKTSITGLKMYLATDVLEMHSKRNASRISYDQLVALLQEKSTKKYSINYNVLDECIDISKNKEAIREKMNSLFTEEEAKESLEQLEKTEVLIPYLFMDKLRNTVWSKLGEFFKLCEQSVCSECANKSRIYFQFIQAVALYEIFYIQLVQNQAVNYLECATAIVEKIKDELCKAGDKVKELQIRINTKGEHIQVEQIEEIQNIAQGICKVRYDEFLEDMKYVEIYQLLEVEFGISLTAMCYLLMLLEAIQVCSYEMRGIKHLSRKIEKDLRDIYARDLAMLVKSNHKRESRYRKVNKYIEELIEKQNPEYKLYEDADIIYTFMTELCKPVRLRNEKAFRGLEVMLGYPVYKEVQEEAE